MEKNISLRDVMPSKHSLITGFNALQIKLAQEDIKCNKMLRLFSRLLTSFFIEDNFSSVACFLKLVKWHFNLTFSKWMKKNPGRFYFRIDF